MFEFLAGAARARLVAADFLGLANELRDRISADRKRLRLGWRSLGRGELFGSGVLELHRASEALLTLFLFAIDVRLRAQLHPAQHRDRVVLDAIEHRGEQLE